MMPTPLHSGKPVRRETAVVYRGRPLIVEIHPGYLKLREKGRRTSVSLDYRTALEVAYKILWKQEQAEKKAAGRKKR